LIEILKEELRNRNIIAMSKDNAIRESFDHEESKGWRMEEIRAKMNKDWRSAVFVEVKNSTGERSTCHINILQ
jgi:hypothetical protein